MYEDIEKLKREYQEHIAVLEMQAKTHKEDWDAERKEKQKVVREKEDLERKVQELMREVNFLKTLVAEEKNRKLGFSSSLDDGAVFATNEYFSSTPNTFRSAVHAPHNAVSVTAKFKQTEILQEI